MRKVLAVTLAVTEFLSFFLQFKSLTKVLIKYILGNTVNKHGYWLKRNKDCLPLGKKQNKKTLNLQHEQQDTVWHILPGLISHALRQHERVQSQIALQ